MNLWWILLAVLFVVGLMIQESLSEDTTYKTEGKFCPHCCSQKLPETADTCPECGL